MLELFIAFLVAVSVLMLLGIAAHYWGHDARRNSWTQSGGYDPREDWNTNY